MFVPLSSVPEIPPGDFLLYIYKERERQAVTLPHVMLFSPKGRDVVGFKTGHIKSTASFFLGNSLEYVGGFVVVV